MSLSASDVLAFTGKCPTKVVSVPAFKNAAGSDEITVRGMTSDEVEMHQARVARLANKKDGEGRSQASAHLIYLCAMDESGGRLFTKDQIPQLAQLPALYIEPLIDAIGKLSIFDEDAEDEARGESEAAQTSSSPSE